MKVRLLTILITIIVCASTSGAQTLTATYVALADSADHYIKHERWADAGRVIVEALKHEPANPSNYLLWNNLGIVRMETGDYEGAVQAYDIGLASAPKSTQLLSNRARTLLKFNHTDEALADLDKSLALDSTLQWPLRVRGIILLGKTKPEAALRDFNTYLRHYKEDATVMTARGDAWVLLNDYDKAMGDYRRAAELDEEDPEPTDKLLFLAYTRSALADEEKTLRAALRKWPKHGNFHLLLGALHRERYQNAEAEEDRKLALEYGADPQTVELILPKIKK